MAVEIRRDLLRYHAQLHLSLLHAAIGTFPCHGERAALSVNRLLLVFDDGGRDDSRIKDWATGKILPMRAGHVYFIPCRHIIDQHQTEALHFVSFQFTLDLFYGFDVLSQFPACRVLDDPHLVAEARQLIQSPDVPMVLCRINEIIYQLCGRWLSENPEILSRDMKFRSQYEALLDYVETDGDALTTVGTLAEMMGMRSDVFSRKFTRDMGISPKDFLTRAQVRKTSQLLSSSGMTIKEIANRLRYSSEYYLSRFFKKQVGMAPNDFRKMSGGDLARKG